MSSFALNGNQLNGITIRHSDMDFKQKDVLTKMISPLIIKHWTSTTPA